VLHSSLISTMLVQNIYLKHDKPFLFKSAINCSHDYQNIWNQFYGNVIAALLLNYWGPGPPTEPGGSNPATIAVANLEILKAVDARVYTSGVHFQKCSKFSIFFTLNVSTIFHL